MNSKILHIPFAKVDSKNRIVEGYATTQSRDSDGEVILRSAIEAALPDYLKYSNIRFMHEMKPVGRTESAEMDDIGLKIKAKIVDDDCWKLITEKVVTGFSIGGQVTERDKKDNSIIKGIKLFEISVVDRPANPDAIFELAKVADAEWAKAKSDDDEDEENVDDEPEADEEEDLVDEEQRKEREGKKNEEDEKKLADCPLTKEEQDNWIERFGLESFEKNFGKLPSVIAEKRKFSDKQRAKLADDGKALPDGSFPIETVKDLENAIHAYGRAKDKAKAKAHIIARANALDAMDKLPSDWDESEKEPMEPKTVKPEIKKSFSIVSQLAQTVEQLNCICKQIHLEESMENDTETTVPEQMDSLVLELAQLVSDYAGEEKQELHNSMNNDTDVPYLASSFISNLYKKEKIDIDELEKLTKSTNKDVKRLAKISMSSMDLFAKIGAKHSEDTMNNVQDIHDTLVKAFPAVQCGGDEMALAVKPGDLAKAQHKLELSRKANDDLYKTINQLNKRISELENAPPRARPVMAIDKGLIVAEKANDRPDDSYTDEISKWSDDETYRREFAKNRVKR